MKTFFIIVSAKLLIFVGKLLNRGSVQAGNFAYKLDNNIFKKLKLPNKVIAVTGSSGKGSTTKLIADVYRRMGYKVVHNSSGSNLRAGILTALLDKCSLTGKLNYDVFVVEMDERWAKLVFPEINPDYVVITNVTRDQPPRQGNFDIVYEDIKKALKPNMHLVINGDDPYLQKINDGTFKDITYFGVKGNKYSYKKNKFKNLNIFYCPRCNCKLSYNYYHFETLGDYYCPECGFSRPVIDYLVTNVSYDDKTITINDSFNTKLAIPMLFDVYNTAAAIALLSTDGISIGDVCTQIGNRPIASNIFKDFVFNNRKVVVFSNKNENSTTFNHSLLSLDQSKNVKTIVIGWKEISRRYAFNDLSWLYDIDFEILTKHNIDKVICVGRDCYDIATRIKLSGIDQNKIVCFSELSGASDYIKTKTKNDIYAILNFDYVQSFNDLFEGEQL